MWQRGVPAIFALLAGAGLLAACSSTYAPPPGKGEDQARLERDRADCEAVAARRDPLADTALGFLGGAFWGAASGASFGSTSGGVGAGEAAAVGAAAGAVLGMFYGAVAGNQDVEDAMDRCMEGKGYRIE